MSVANTVQPDNPSDDPLESLTWRCIGPFRGGRVVAVSGHPKDPLVAYFGACAGGVWKTIDEGQTWNNVSDSYFGGSIGAVAINVCPSFDVNFLWARINYYSQAHEIYRNQVFPFLENNFCLTAGETFI